LTAQILGTDHIGLTGLNILEDKFFKSFQYNTLFSESGLKNLNQKQSFLSTEIPIHDVIFLRNKKGVSVEAVDYHKNSPSPGKYDVIIEWSSEFTQKNIIQENDEIANKLGDIKKGKIPESDIPFYFKKGLDRGITSVILQVSNMEKSLSLWQNTFNFQVESGGDSKFNSLSLPSLVPSWNLKLILIENNKLTKIDSWLNSFGWNCISLITKDIESEIKLINNNSEINCGTPYLFEIANKKFKIVFIKGHDLELIELIQPVE